MSVTGSLSVDYPQTSIKPISTFITTESEEVNEYVNK